MSASLTFGLRARDFHHMVEENQSNFTHRDREQDCNFAILFLQTRIVSLPTQRTIYHEIDCERRFQSDCNICDGTFDINLMCSSLPYNLGF